MPVFLYRALDAKGRAHEDEIVADSAAAAREALRRKGLYPVDVRDDQGGRRGLFPDLFRRERFSNPDLVSFTRQLATLLNAGLQIVPALSALIRQSRAEAARRVLVRIREAVREGASLAQAMGAFPQIFSAVYVSLVRAGERSGGLGAILTRLAEFLELQQSLRRRLAGALAYPALMAVTGLGVLAFMLGFVVPRVVQIFRQSQQELPWPTRFLIRGSEFFQDYFLLLLAALVALGAAAAAWRRTEAGRRFLDAAALRLPLMGDLLARRAVARFARTLGLLLASGMPILDALVIARLVVGNAVLEEAVEQAREETGEGGRLSAALERSGRFPTMLTDMVGVGEQSGSLDAMLIHVSDHFDREAEAAIQAMMALVEPLLILVLGVVVGFVVMAVLWPLFEISQLVR